MKSSDIRKKFTDFFSSKDHLAMASSSLVPQGDTTVLLTTAGMQQMMPSFLGATAAPHHRITTIQKCFRTNDIDEVGDAYHNTFFEMMGNFSVGDYFKEGAIEFAYEFLTKHVAIPAEKLWVTVHPTEDVADKKWVEMGIPKERIFIDETNFWGPPGESGPCGPDSEIYYDFGVNPACTSEVCSPLCECGRFLEIWNLVFMEFFQDKDGKRTPLPKQNIDTGMGFERIIRVLQGKESIYDTDLLEPLMTKIYSTFTLQAGNLDERTMRNVRIIADHTRAATFLAGDGVTPSNIGRGYVMRRIIRRAVRSGYLLDNKKGLFLHDLIDAVIGIYNEPYPYFSAKAEEIHRIVEEEEGHFLKTLEKGVALLDEVIAKSSAQGISGEDAFKLYDTYGFPIELTKEIADEKGVAVDENGFAARMEEQKERSRRSSQFSVQTDTAIYQDLADHLASTDFLGYSQLSSEAKVVALIKEGETVSSVAAGEEVDIILHQTPFYARGGGQIGDIGILEGEGIRVSITDARPAANFIVHRGQVTEGTLTVGAKVTAKVDVTARTHTARHHTATHLLHQALRDTFGESVKQAGSSVDPKRLRFDFTFSRKIEADELRNLETIVNEKIAAAIPVETVITSLDEARKLGAMALFDGKYSSDVRMVVIGGWSRELCGGTHVKNTNELGTFVISKEEAVAGGIRRVRAHVE